MQFTTPSGRFVSVPAKERRQKAKGRQIIWQRALLWHHLATVGFPDQGRRTRPMTRAEIAKLFGVSRPLVSRWVSDVEQLFQFTKGIRDND